MGYLAAALVTGLASIGAGIAVAASASAAIVQSRRMRR
jgi:F0F1-type ATP synthase membrane subunit c/vacuolar-type H+-ATPase subunit K